MVGLGGWTDVTIAARMERTVEREIAPGVDACAKKAC